MTYRWLQSTTWIVLCFAACSRPPEGPKDVPRDAEPQIVGAKGKGQATEPRVGGDSEAPVETAPPNVPEFSPAFPGQTRAPALHTQTAFEITTVAKGFALPWAIAFLPDRRMLVTEKHAGKVYIVSTGGEKSEPIAGVPKVDGRGQGGLLDVELDPKFSENSLVYLSYYEPRKDGNGLAVLRAKFVDGKSPKLTEAKVIFRMFPTLDSDKHAGGRLLFAPDGLLFVTLGDRSVMEGRVQARDLASDFGKIVRIHPDGSIPKDNPFAGQKGARPEIWSLGHRNVLGAALDATGRLWIAEMGPRGGDELNLVKRGKDYGWPTIGYGEEYSGASIHKTTQERGLEQPAYYWDPVISPGALAVYQGELIPEWRGNLLIAGLSGQALVRLAIQGDRVVGEERLLVERGDRFREVAVGPEGAVYLLTDGGELLKLAPRAKE